MSVQKALDLGVSQESVFSRLLNSIPDSVDREYLISKVAKKYNLSDKDIEYLMAPED